MTDTLPDPALIPTRIEPQLDDEGRPIELAPPTGGRWVRHADGGLAPADETTAIGAGLRWAD